MTRTFCLKVALFLFVLLLFGCRWSVEQETARYQARTMQRFGLETLAKQEAIWFEKTGGDDEEAFRMRGWSEDLQGWDLGAIGSLSLAGDLCYAIFTKAVPEKGYDWKLFMGPFGPGEAREVPVVSGSLRCGDRWYVQIAAGELYVFGPTAFSTQGGDCKREKTRFEFKTPNTVPAGSERVMCLGPQCTDQPGHWVK